MKYVIISLFILCMQITFLAVYLMKFTSATDLISSFHRMVHHLLPYDVNLTSAL